MQYATRAERQNIPFQTPRVLFDAWDREADGFAIDLFASANNALCKRFFTAEDDAITSQWKAKGKAVFANPTYGGNMQAEVIDKALTEVRVAERCREAWLLLQANTSSSWFRKAVETSQVWLFAGRINFDVPTGHQIKSKQSSSTFANALVVVRQVGSPTGIMGFRSPRTGLVLPPLEHVEYSPPPCV